MSRVTVMSTFTAKPVSATLTHWCRELGLADEVTFTPAGQVTQSLLAPERQHCQAPTVLLLRWEDSLRHLAPELASRHTTLLEQAFSDLVDAIHGWRRGTSAPMLIAICPPSKAYPTAQFARFDADLVWSLRGTADIEVMELSEQSTGYEVPSVHDPVADRLGHIPYTAEFFTVIGTVLARRLHAQLRHPARVVLNPEGLLWGSGHPLAHRILAAMLRRQSLAGQPVLFRQAAVERLTAYPWLALGPSHVSAETSGETEPGTIVLVPDEGQGPPVPGTLRLPVASPEQTRAVLGQCWALDLPAGSRRSAADDRPPNVYLTAPADLASIRRAVAAERQSSIEVS